MTVEIMFNDLSKEKQQEILELYKINKAEDANLDIIALTIIEEPELEETTK